MYVLLKHEPYNPYKPYHFESLRRYEARPPGNKNYKLFGVYDSMKEVFAKIDEDIKAKNG